MSVLVTCLRKFSDLGCSLLLLENNFQKITRLLSVDGNNVLSSFNNSKRKKSIVFLCNDALYLSFPAGSTTFQKKIFLTQGYDRTVLESESN